MAGDLAHRRGPLERASIEEARAFAGELERRWPDSERVRHPARALAPPVARRSPGGHCPTPCQGWETDRAAFQGLSPLGYLPVPLRG